jgi:hypothetical protein
MIARLISLNIEKGATLKQAI